MADVHHVVPINDPPGHLTEGIACACCPKVEHYDNGNTLVIHNSWDGREILELALDYVCEAVN